MIERNILVQKMKEFHIKEFIASEFMKTGYSHTKIQRTPLGDKITIYTSRPGLVVGRKGENIRKLTNTLKNKFKMENPQIEIGDIENPYFDAQSIAEKIAYTLEKFGPQRFKSIGYKTLQSIMDAGAMGAEIVVCGKIPSSRAKTWRFMDGYLKKCGYVSDKYVIKGRSTAFIKAGAVGINVSIMPPGLTLPDDVKLIEQKPELKEEEPKKEVKDEKSEGTKGNE
ncbi:MAG: 30S ribosomal protein S3 [Nanoarchaeota archaeon]|nr:30S ribosomal protein S3 [Nanoarchaeota archaeon]|tara:strand:+ start:613 stop:1287 length:675 start_codon:yes stop_codon:yes gene_type:complete